MKRRWNKVPKFTEEQQRAIDEEGKNILVSAGAGSGKTAVLTERVLRKIKQGGSISSLLILTFTNKAAAEMKERIRKKLQKENMNEQLDLLDSSYITTFDAFSLSIVKKYADILKVPKNVAIAENSILVLQKRAFLEEILANYYQHPTKTFEGLISYFCLKDDKSFQDKILALDETLELELDKEQTLSQYVDNYFDPKHLKTFQEEYLTLLCEKKQMLENALEDVKAQADGKYYQKVATLLEPILAIDSYLALKKSLQIESFPRLPSKSSEELKQTKQKIMLLLQELLDLACYDNEEEMLQSIMNMKPYVEVIIAILQELEQKMVAYKQQRQLYTFMDIEKLAIALVRDHAEAREEIKQQFQEILIDEYQDTNDIQETFISYIAKDNLYMVGDIKQSIYRFRNANPLIFKEKYDRYQQGDGGIVIDLTKNFRSRKEVLDDINMLFAFIMDDKIGGAEYRCGHEMIFGNMTYEEKAKTKDEHHLEIISYDASNKESSKVEKEAFLIADDIKQKLADAYLVYDKDDDKLRQIEYRDFVILLDRSTDFLTYRQIFEHLQIPLTLWQDEKASSEVDLYLLKNFFVLLHCMATNQYDASFFMAFTCLGRSFLLSYSDDMIYHYVANKTYRDSSLYKLFLPFAKSYNSLTPSSFLRDILAAFHYQEKLTTITNLDIMNLRMEYFVQLVTQLETSGFLMDDVCHYFQTVMDTNFEIKLPMSRPDTNSVKIMTIHTSKGLEYPICYFAGFTKKFNDSDFKETVFYDRNYGLVLPDIIKDQDLITKTLSLQAVQLADIGEKIRLLYVALTRAREKMILLLPEEEEILFTGLKVDDFTRLQYRSFEMIMKSIYSMVLSNKRNVEAIPSFSKAYLSVQSPSKFQHTKEKELEIIPSLYQNTLLEKQTFSKEVQDVDENLLAFGRYVHQLLERCDFSNFSIPKIEDKRVEKKILAFLNQPFLKQHQNDKFYQEFEFYYQEDKRFAHGKIDLLIVSKTCAFIVDYKLKHIVDKAYVEQLKGYQKAIQQRLDLPVYCYLYSVMDEELVLVLEA